MTATMKMAKIPTMAPTVRADITASDGVVATDDEARTMAVAVAVAMVVVIVRLAKVSRKTVSVVLARVTGIATARATIVAVRMLRRSVCNSSALATQMGIADMLEFGILNGERTRRRLLKQIRRR